MKNEEIELAEIIEESEKQFIATLTNVNQSAQLIMTTSNSIYDVAKQFIDLKRDLALMDLQFDSYIAKLENDRELFNKKATIVNGLLQSTSERMDIILKRLLQSDFSSLKKEDVEMRQQLIELLSEQNDNFCDMFLKLMSK